MPIKQITSEFHRLSILHCLEAMENYSTNNNILQSVCAGYGNDMTLDEVATHLHWLAEQGLVSLEHNKIYTIATLTRRGLDVQQGRARVPGVKRPSPKV